MTKKKSPRIKLTPLGGVGEIGSNCTLIETKTDYIIIDYGILFPYDSCFNINYLIPDYKIFRKDKDIILFITHGHEDHIGGIVDLVKNVSISKIYAPLFAKKLILEKFEYAKINFPIEEYNANSVIKFNEMSFTPFRVNHSIPDTYGVIIKTYDKDLGILFISDFKIDKQAKHEPILDLENLTFHFKDIKYKVCLLDSTNVFSLNNSISEEELVYDLHELLKRKNRIFITLFSSNIFRMINILEIAKKEKKTTVLIGRSVKSYLKIADDAKILKLDNYKIKDLEEIQDLNDQANIFIVSGCQGDFYSSLTRLVTLGYKEPLVPQKNDLFIFSSKSIPGNEKNINRLQNKIVQSGADLATANEYKIHASGHASREDLESVLNAVAPDLFIPIHGEAIHLKKHQELTSLIKNENNKPIDAKVIQNFETLYLFDLKDKKKKNYYIANDYEALDPLLIQTKNEEIFRDNIKERRKIAEAGLFMININAKNSNIKFNIIGFPLNEKKEQELFKLIKPFINQLSRSDHDQLSEEIRITARRKLLQILKYRPVVIVNII